MLARAAHKQVLERCIELSEAGHRTRKEQVVDGEGTMENVAAC
jgi:hypothetical protein